MLKEAKISSTPATKLSSGNDFCVRHGFRVKIS